MIKVLLYSLLPMIAAILAAIIGALQTPSNRMRSATQHLAAGVVFAAVGLEMGPDLLKRHGSISTAIGFCIGVGVFVLIRYLTEKPIAESSDSSKTAEGGLSSYIVTIATDLLVDGVMIGIGFIAGAKAGILLTIALTIELISLALALVSYLRGNGKTMWSAIGFTAALTTLVPVGSVIGMFVVSPLPEQIINGTIAAGTAALLYLVTEELLRDAHEQPEGPFTTATFFAGFLVVLLIDMRLG